MVTQNPGYQIHADSETRYIPGPAIFNTVKTLEQFFLTFLTDSQPIVSNSHSYFFTLKRAADQDITARRRIFDRIADQIGEDLADLSPVRINPYPRTSIQHNNLF